MVREAEKARHTVDAKKREREQSSSSPERHSAGSDTGHHCAAGEQEQLSLSRSVLPSSLPQIKQGNAPTLTRVPS